MKIILKIARTELQMLFYSPIAWLLLLCFIIQTGLKFTSVYQEFMFHMENYGSLYKASSWLFVSNYGQIGLWYIIQNFLYLYIPLLTMGIVSKELNSGSIKLFYAAPISNVQIILGKFLSLVVYSAILTGILAIYVVYAWCTIENFEAAWVLTGLLGLFMLMCTYMAVGIFVSCLTSYQIIAAVGTFMVLMLLGMVSSFGQHYDFVRDVTYWLSINGRVSTFIQGMLCSEDILYFPVITAMFLALTIIRLDAIRQKQKFTKVVSKYVTVVLTVCVVAYVSSQPMFWGYYDTTATKENTLTPVSQEIIDKLDGGMKITSYVNVLDPHYASNYAYPGFIIYNQRFFRMYTKFKPEVKLDVVYYYADTEETTLGGQYAGMSAWEKAKVICEMTGMDSCRLKTKEEVDQMVDLSEEGYMFIRQIERENGQKEWLRNYEGGFFPGEGEITVALKRMVMPLPKIGFVTGHNERDIADPGPRGYNRVSGDKHVMSSVWNQGFDVEEVTLRKRIPEDIVIVVIPDPKVAFTPEEEVVLQEYIDRGGNLFVLGEPRNREVLNPALRKFFGLELTPVLVGGALQFKTSSPDVLGCLPTEWAKTNLPDLRRTYELAMLGTSGVESVEDKGFELHPITETDSRSDYWTEVETTDYVDDTVRFNPAAGEVSKRFATVMGLTRQVGEKEQRIIISGDADVLSNNAFIVNTGLRSINGTLMLGGCYWMSEGLAPIDVSRPMTTDNKVDVSVSGLTYIKWGFLGVFPLLVLGIAVYQWIRRRGR